MIRVLIGVALCGKSVSALHLSGLARLRDISSALTSALPPPPQINPVPLVPVSAAGADPDMQSIVEDGESIQEMNKYKV